MLRVLTAPSADGPTFLCSMSIDKLLSDVTWLFGGDVYC
jgi:hypothetical protein